MKKIVLSLVVAIAVMGVGVVAFADGDNNGIPDFQQMLPFMKQMHPDVSDQQLEDMYNACHGPNGAMQNTNLNQMMNSSGMMGL